MPYDKTSHTPTPIQILEQELIQALETGSTKELNIPALEIGEKEEIIRQFHLDEHLLNHPDQVILHEAHRIIKRQSNDWLDFRDVSNRIAGFDFNWRNVSLRRRASCALPRRLLTLPATALPLFIPLPVSSSVGRVHGVD